MKLSRIGDPRAKLTRSNRGIHTKRQASRDSFWQRKAIFFSF